MSVRFNEGDVVRLKSGGPLMTIVWIVDGELARLAWHDTCGFHFLTEDNELLPLHALEHA